MKKLALVTMLLSGCGAAELTAVTALHAACVSEQQSIVDDATPDTATESRAQFESTVRVCTKLRARVSEMVEE